MKTCFFTPKAKPPVIEIEKL